MGKFGRKARILMAAARVGTDPEKQRAYIDKQFDALSPEKQLAVALKANAVLKAFHKDPCHIDQHEDCIDEKCKCSCHAGQHFIPFSMEHPWAWTD